MAAHQALNATTAARPTFRPQSGMHPRRSVTPLVTRSIHEGARDLARDIATTDAYVTSRSQRKRVEMLFAHLKRIPKLDRLRLRAPTGAKDEFPLGATAQNLRKMAKLIPMPKQMVPA